MKLKTSVILAIIHFAFSIFNSHAAEYTVRGERWLRMYTADRATPVYNARLDAARIVNGFCNVPWTKSNVASAHETVHATTNLDANVANREAFDAALFCARHADSMHVAYANAACYRIDLGSGTLPNLTSLAVNVYSDPYNAGGARIVLLTNDSGKIPTDCATVRGDVAGGIRATNVARRVTVTSGGKDYWYPNSTNLVFSAQQLGASGIQLHRYLYVFVLLEDYGTTRGDWLEGSAFIDSEIRITTSAAVPSMSDGFDIAEPYATTYHLKDGRAGDDDDGDGLSNYAEYLISEVFKFATLSPDNPKSNGTTPDFFRKVGDCYLGEIFTSRKAEAESDVKDVTARIVYNGPQDIDALTVEAWKDYRGPKPDAIWRLSKSDAASSDFNSMTFNLGKPDKGHLRKGNNTFIAYSGSAYVAGAPYGFARDVNVGMNAAEVELDLTDTNPVFARIKLDDGSNDRATIFGIDSGNVEAILHEGVEALSGGTRNHVRIVPYSYSCWAFEHNPAIDTFEPLINKSYDLANRVVAEFDIDANAHPFITEADFVRDGAYDIDWNEFETKAFAKHPALTGDNVKDITAVRYRIVLGSDGAVTPDSMNDTTTVVRAHSTLIERRFESSSSRTLPSALELDGGSILYGGRPTFKWRLDEPNVIASNIVSSVRFGCSYVAFQIQVADTNDTVIWDSGIQGTPTKDATGRFVWTAPLVTGQLTDRKQVFEKAGDWKWRVAMYNSKFKPQTSPFTASKNGWSDYMKFSTAVGQQQETDDHGYGSIKVAVKYAGPAAVLSNVHVMTNTIGKVRVQAFATPDCSGFPDAEAIVTDAASLANASDATPNVSIDGLKVGGTYWIRAYIDSDGDLQHDEWESWGKATDAVRILKGKASPTATVWIEDADSDFDWIPDAWEIARYGSLTNVNMSAKSGGIISLKTSTYNEMTSGTANISKNLSGASLTFMQNLATTPTLLGYGQAVTTNTLSNIRALIDNNINE